MGMGLLVPPPPLRELTNKVKTLPSASFGMRSVMYMNDTCSCIILKGEDDDVSVSSASECQELGVEYLEKAVDMLRYNRYQIFVIYDYLG